MSDRRDRNDAEIERIFLESGDPTLRDLFLFVKRHSHDGQFQSDSAKVQPTFNFYMRVRLRSGAAGPRVALEYRHGESKVRLYLNWERKYLVPQDALATYREELGDLYGAAIDLSAPEPSVPLEAVAGKLDDFGRIFLRFRDACESAA